MDRRHFLKASAVGWAAAAVAPAARAQASPPPPPLDAGQVERFLRDVERGRAAIARGEGLGDFGARGAGDGDAAATRLLQTSFRALHVAGAFSELAYEDQAHPAVQSVVWGAMPELDASWRGMAGVLAASTGEDRARVRDFLRQHPDTPLRLAEAVDEAGDATGVSPRVRHKFRRVATQVGWRLRHQDPALLVEECLVKARKLDAIPATVAGVERRFAARVGAEAFWDARNRALNASLRWRGLAQASVAAADGPMPGTAAPDAGTPESAGPAPDASSAGAVDLTPSPVVDVAAPRARPGDGSLRTAGWAFGVAALSTTSGALLVATSGNNAGQATLGGVFVLVGGIFLLTAGAFAVTGLARNAGAARPEPPTQEDVLPQGLPR